MTVVDCSRSTDVCVDRSTNLAGKTQERRAELVRDGAIRVSQSFLEG